MTKYKIFFVVSSSLLMLAFLMIFFNGLPRKQCECVAYKKFDQVTIHPNSNVTVKHDSICIMAGCDNGDIINRNFKTK